MKTIVAPEALVDLASAVDHIAQHNPRAAWSLHASVFDDVERLAQGGVDGPQCVLRSGVEVRSWAHPPFRIYYRREPDALHIVRIYHQARRPITK